MKWNSKKGLSALIVLFFTGLLSFALPAQSAEIYTLDPMHTYVLYHINHLGFSIQSGKWFAQGTLHLDKDNPKNSTLNVTIPMANIDTGIPELDKHLKGNLFFDVARFPTATFVSNNIEVVDATHAKVTGTLTMHGVAKPVTLNVTLNKTGINDITDKMSAGFSASASLKRSDFGITTFLPKLGDEVQLDIEAEAYKAGS